MSDKLKGLNVDIQSFAQFKNEGCYYIDKTRYIKDILLNSGTTVLFTRPRRFGKTITLSMLQSFLEMNYENPSDKSKQIELFKDTEIFKDKDFCDKYMGQYPVIYLSLKEAFDIDGYENCLTKIYKKLGKFVQKFNFLTTCDKLTEDEQETLKRILTIRTNSLSVSEKKSDAEELIGELTQYLYKYTGKKCIVLIDEYDVPLSKVSHLDFYQNIRQFISNLFSAGLKNNEALEKGVISGCLRVAKESIFTGLNNFQSFGLENSRFSSLFGFTETEVKTMLSYYKLDDKYPEYQEWYDGYHIGDADIFCPWDVICRTEDLIAKRMTPESYWGGTGNIDSLQDMFAKNPKAYAENFETLLNGGSITITINNDINYEILGRSQNINHFWSLMFSSGYLTIKQLINHTDDTTEAELIIPNKSVRHELKNIIEWYFSVENPKFLESITELIDDLKESDPRVIQRYLTKALTSYVSVYDTQKGTDKESMYHAFLNGRLSAVLNFNENKYVSNGELGDGRADFSFILDLDDSKNSPTAGFIIEIKAAKSEEQMSKLAKEAIAQAKEKNYVKAMFDRYEDDIDEVRVLGIAFYKKSCKVAIQSFKA